MKLIDLIIVFMSDSLYNYLNIDIIFDKPQDVKDNLF